MDDVFDVLVEGEAATELGWIARFEGDRRIFAELLADGILRNSGVSLGRRTFKLNFVGLLSVGKSAWFSFPKASNRRRWSDADIILRAINEYRRKVTRSPSSVDFSATPDRLYSGTLIDTFIAMLLWTLNRGFHHQAVDDSRSRHEGIDWARTISATPAMHSNASVVYPYPITRIQSNELSELAEVQAHALLDMRQRLGAFANIIAPNVEDLWEKCTEVLEHRNSTLHPNLIESIIQDYGGATNRDDDLEIIDLLRDWSKENWSAGPRLSAYGISAFHTVWEDMCVQALSSFGENIQHAEAASQPTYLLDGQAIALTPQRPDILLRRGEGAVVADAKWYLLDEKALPQTPDAIKQFAYELSINREIDVDANLLLLPSEKDQNWCFAGSLQMTHAERRDTRFQPVSIVALNWLYLAELYVAHQRLPDQFIRDVVALRKRGFAVEMQHQPDAS